MAGFPITAWAMRHPWGADTTAVLDHLRAPRGAPLAATTTAPELATSLLDELAPACAKACARWGASRVASILGSAAPTVEHPLSRLAQTLALVRRHTGIGGAAYHIASTETGGVKALASADRMLRASLADAVLVGGIDDDHGALLLVERHGTSFVDLHASAEATGATDHSTLDEAAAARTIAAAWAVGGRAPLGYVHVHADDDDPHAAAERRVIHSVVGDVPCCATRRRLGSAGAGAGAIDVALAAASLSRGFTPEPHPRELEHDRVLLHAFSPRGHHVTLLLEARE
ncbi:beta-ketoacyl-[acyl-carrier-protein] synthase family protein [Paraliomyxa miuraensis]|uniref:hypothetical protein n=1 Tax=Paraliomyxa miuraensis TaxID=376150 RepID=UPI002256A9BE|nr:hypothetical protein [Paraliomyxa miuraensis]MCX4247714.1 hypothetical protein [Paraliomyxa miuraensis]